MVQRAFDTFAGQPAVAQHGRPAGVETAQRKILNRILPREPPDNAQDVSSDSLSDALSLSAKLSLTIKTTVARNEGKQTFIKTFDEDSFAGTLTMELKGFNDLVDRKVDGLDGTLVCLKTQLVETSSNAAQQLPGLSATASSQRVLTSVAESPLGYEFSIPPAQQRVCHSSAGSTSTTPEESTRISGSELATSVSTTLPDDYEIFLLEILTNAVDNASPAGEFDQFIDALAAYLYSNLIVLEAWFYPRTVDVANLDWYQPVCALQSWSESEDNVTLLVADTDGTLKVNFVFKPCNF